MPDNAESFANAAREISPVLRRNIQALREREREEDRNSTFSDRLAQGISRFSGSMSFVVVHLLALIAWIAINVNWVPGLPAFDPNFVILATAASVESIFLSTFILISQNREAANTRQQADLDLQMSLLSEHEITRVLTLVMQIAEKLDIGEAKDPSLEKLAEDVVPEQVLDEIRIGEEEKA